MGHLAVGVPTLEIAAGVVVVDLNDAVLYPHGVVGAALVEGGEDAVASTDDGARQGRPERCRRAAGCDW